GRAAALAPTPGGRAPRTSPARRTAARSAPSPTPARPRRGPPAPALRRSVSRSSRRPPGGGRRPAAPRLRRSPRCHTAPHGRRASVSRARSTSRAGSRRRKGAGLLIVAGSVHGSREHPLVVPIPIALEPLLRIILSLQAQELSELWIARLELFPCRIAMVGEVIAAVPADGQ